MPKVTITVRLNGTDENPFLKMGLTQNPFSQLGMAEYDGAILHLQKLGAVPIPNAGYIKKHLKGWSEEFVTLCCKQFEKGKMVEFTVSFDL